MSRKVAILSVIITEIFFICQNFDWIKFFVNIILIYNNYGENYKIKIQVE